MEESELSDSEKKYAASREWRPFGSNTHRTIT
jgi:hypothetical protein